MLLLNDPSLRRLLRLLLPTEGWSVEAAASLAEARERARSGGVLLADWGRLDGLMAEERRSELSALAGEVPLVVVVPGFWSRYLSAADLGIAALLPKPFGAVELMAALDLAATWSSAAAPAPAPPRPLQCEPSAAA